MTVQASTVTSMYDLAVSLRDVIAQAMATTVGGPPDREYISLGEPAWDTMCSYAVVQVPTLTEGQTGPGQPPEQIGMRHFRGRVNLVGLTGYAIRCVQVSDDNQQVFSVPSDAQLDLEAQTAYEDGWAVWNLITRLLNDDLLFSGPCGIVHFDGGQAVTPSGGLGGWRFTLRVELGGYDPRS